MQDQITKDMTIDEIFTKFPQRGQRLAQEMQNAGLNCVGCGASVWETLEAGMLGHGFRNARQQIQIGAVHTAKAFEAGLHWTC